ncbi:MAG: hypothetical protein JWS10_1719 [Cypionkella sp.]|uniref:site-specific integrase n=1 Tax=Cypionkella sp. TaxID=2811411 RepID=UPI0026330753|nr:site-specific integrase [Cypionkella sp.]MDB5659104.1 hypothetical protein [Cypionkella sp.]
MNLPKVPGTQIRGTTYHYNLPIPTAIQSQYTAFPAGVMRGTLKTSDPKDAASKIGDQRTIFGRQVKEAQRLAERDRILGTLGQEDRDLLAEIGGAEKLLGTIRDLRLQAAFTLAGSGADIAILRETTDTAEHTLRVAEEVSKRESEAGLTTLTAEIRRLKHVAENLGEGVLGDEIRVPATKFFKGSQTPGRAETLKEFLATPPKGIDESGDGIRELAARFADANSWTIQNRESLALTVRRWIEMHGDLSVAKWERRHLDQFDKVLAELPLTNRADLRKLTIHKAVEKAKRDKLSLISFKVRDRYSTHMKALTKYALNTAGLIQADPFAGYQPRKAKEKFSEQKITTTAYTPKQVGAILDHCAVTYDTDVIDYWLPILAAFTGARREELGQLLVKDVYTEGNFQVISITDNDPAQKIKNKHSLRLTPLPSAVVAAGFLEYVERRRKAGGHFLFLEDLEGRKVARAEVEQDKRGRLTERYGHRFARGVRDKLGFKLPGLNLHSLRHSWTDAARRAKIDPEIRRLIAGRLDGEDATEAGYGGNELLADKLEALEAVAAFVWA